MVCQSQRGVSSQPSGNPHPTRRFYKLLSVDTSTMSVVMRLSILLLVLCLLIQGIQALRCYQCSKFDDNCHKHSSDSLKEYEKDCANEMNYCRILEVENRKGGFHRGCALQCTVDDASKTKTACCKNDLCNATQRPMPSTIIFLITGSTMAAIFVRFFS